MMTFDQYLNTLPAAQGRAIKRAEREWLRSRHFFCDNLTRDFDDQMEGYEVPTGGSGRRLREGFDF